MTATSALPENLSRWIPGSGARVAPPPLRTATLEFGRSADEAHGGRVIVHLVGFEATARERISGLFASVGVETRTHADVGAFVGDALPDAPGCILVQARFALIGALDYLAHFARCGAALPMIVAADQADVRTAVLAMKAGAVDFLEKPLRDSDILEAVGAAIRIDRARRRAEAHRAELRARFATLTQRERQVMALVTQGLLNKQVAGDLGISEVTVKVHRAAAMRKMGARTLAHLVRMADTVAERSEAGA